MNTPQACGVWFFAKDTQRYLYLLRNDKKHQDCWGLPGGKVERGESLFDAIPMVYRYFERAIRKTYGGYC